MGRHHLFEIHDFSICPQIIRDGLTNFLQVSTDLLNTYEPIRPLLLEAIERSGSRTVVDLCAGAGGPWVKWCRQGLATVSVTLTDKFPNRATVERLADSALTSVRYYPQSVDAASVVPTLPGFRTMFTAFHHFTPTQAKAIIQDAVRNGQGIGIFEFTDRTLLGTLGMLLTPIGVWLFTPKMRRVRWQVLMLTYLLPVIPLVTCIDGILSCLRSYTVRDLEQLCSAPEYEWAVGKKNQITYLIGLPKIR